LHHHHQRRVGIFVSNDNVTIEGNQIHDIGGTRRGEWLQPTPCTTNNDHGLCRWIVHQPTLTIKNNIFYRNERGWSIQFYPAAVSNLRVLNNTSCARTVPERATSR